MSGLRAVWVVVVLILIAVISVMVYPFFLKPEENKVGTCLHLSDYGCSTVSHLTELGVSWVRTDWEITDDNLMGDYSQRLQDNNINLLAIIDINTFNQTIPTLEDWESNVTKIVTSEGFNNTDAVEIWNEPNADAYIPPETYYEMLKSAYSIVKNYTRIPVVFTGVSPDWDDWQGYLNTVFAHDDVEDYFDFMGIHFYFEHMEENLNVLQFVKDLADKPIWLTETGKPSEKENYSETFQAKYLELVCSTFKPLVNKTFIYELKDNPNLSTSKEGYFGLLTADGIQKEAYQVVCDINRK